jgi:hypothetical protein
MSIVPPHNMVAVRARPLWRIRIERELPRYLLQALAVIGLLASARFAIAPPRPVLARSSTPSTALPDRAAEGFAALFARRYLTWDSADPEAHSRALASFVGGEMEANAGLQVPPSGEQRVEWAQVVQARAPRAGEHVYTVAAETDTAGVLYLTVTVLRASDGSLRLAGYPALVGLP